MAIIIATFNDDEWLLLLSALQYVVDDSIGFTSAQELLERLKTDGNGWFRWEEEDGEDQSIPG